MGGRPTCRRILFKGRLIKNPMPHPASEPINFFESGVSGVELLSSARPGEEQILQDFLDAFNRIGLDDSIAEAAGRYVSLYRKSHGINTADAIIAASTLVRGAVLYTLNEKHFPMSDITVIKPY